MSGEAVFPGYPVRVVCPRCRGALRNAAESVRCAECAVAYPLEDGFGNLIVGERFADETPDEELPFDERSSGATTRAYWIPLFRRVADASPGETRILSLGCGVGAEIDELGRAGFAAGGVDSGSRTRAWKHREYPERLLLANGLWLPFDDGCFDIVFCGCVFPHVGVVGDTWRVTEDYFDQRLRLAQEVARVLRPGGTLLAASPNRSFPLDLFHRPAGKVGRLNRPRDPFLLSLDDYAAVFTAAGFECPRALSPRNYWSLHRSRATLMGRLLGTGVSALFRLNSGPGWLRTGAIAPWIVVAAQRPWSA